MLYSLEVFVVNISDHEFCTLYTLFFIYYDTHDIGAWAIRVLVLKI